MTPHPRHEPLPMAHCGCEGFGDDYEMTIRAGYDPQDRVYIGPCKLCYGNRRVSDLEVTIRTERGK